MIFQGKKGDRGATGPDGQKGDQGDKGDKGDKGDTGDQGPEGPEGPQGATGPDGQKGDQGDKGDKGDKGDQGPEGPEGPQGPIGPGGDPGAGFTLRPLSKIILSDASHIDMAKDSKITVPFLGNVSEPILEFFSDGLLFGHSSLPLLLKTNNFGLQVMEESTIKNVAYKENTVEEVVGGQGITIDNSNPQKPVIIGDTVVDPSYGFRLRSYETINISSSAKIEMDSRAQIKGNNTLGNDLNILDYESKELRFSDVNMKLTIDASSDIEVNQSGVTRTLAYQDDTLQNVVQGSGISIDYTDKRNPIISMNSSPAPEPDFVNFVDDTGFISKGTYDTPWAGPGDLFMMQWDEKDTASYCIPFAFVKKVTYTIPYTGPSSTNVDNRVRLRNDTGQRYSVEILDNIFALGFLGVTKNFNTGYSGGSVTPIVVKGRALKVLYATDSDVAITQSDLSYNLNVLAAPTTVNADGDYEVTVTLPNSASFASTFWIPGYNDADYANLTDEERDQKSIENFVFQTTVFPPNDAPGFYKVIIKTADNWAPFHTQSNAWSVEGTYLYCTDTSTFDMSSQVTFSIVKSFGAQGSLNGYGFSANDVKRCYNVDQPVRSIVNPLNSINFNFSNDSSGNTYARVDRQTPVTTKEAVPHLCLIKITEPETETTLPKVERVLPGSLASGFSHCVGGALEGEDIVQISSGTYSMQVMTVFEGVDDGHGVYVDDDGILTVQPTEYQVGWVIVNGVVVDIDLYNASVVNHGSSDNSQFSIGPQTLRTVGETLGIATPSRGDQSVIVSQSIGEGVLSRPTAYMPLSTQPSQYETTVHDNELIAKEKETIFNVVTEGFYAIQANSISFRFDTSPPGFVFRLFNDHDETLYKVSFAKASRDTYFYLNNPSFLIDGQSNLYISVMELDGTPLGVMGQLGIQKFSFDYVAVEQKSLAFDGEGGGGGGTYPVNPVFEDVTLNTIQDESQNAFISMTGGDLSIMNPQRLWDVDVGCQYGCATRRQFRLSF